jgi:hypothetical protein
MPTARSTKRAISHLWQLSDTDILPPLFEFRFFADCSDVIADKLENINFGDYRPKSCFEVLSPKTKLSFRIAHQLYPLDTLLYTSAVLDVAMALEEMRLSVEEGPFSYRYVDDEDEPQLYSNSGSYHDWLLHVQKLCEKDNPFDAEKYVIETDISDFYPRIYFHRIEHILDDCEAQNSVRKIIEGIIKFSRAHQSHGLPVGSAASRLLAEAVLNDTDRMLKEKTLAFARYVDDYRIIVPTSHDAHSILCRLAEHLMLAEGLSLNAAKTRIVTTEQESALIEDKFTDVFTSSEIADLNRYFQLVYDGEDVSFEDIEGVSASALMEKLSEILAREFVDYSAIKVILKAMRAVEVETPTDIISKYSVLLYYCPRDYCTLIGTLAQKYPESSEEIATKIVSLVSQSPFSDMTLSRLWVAHLFVSQALPISSALLEQLNLKGGVIEKRQSLLLKGLLGDRAYFREQKTRFDQVSDWEKSALLLAMSCLSKSEYEKWLAIVKVQYNDTLADEYFRWLKVGWGNLFDRLKVDYIIKSRQEQTDELLDSSDAESPF